MGGLAVVGGAGEHPGGGVAGVVPRHGHRWRGRPRDIVTRGETGQGQEAQRHDTRHGPGSRGTRVLMTRAVTGAVRICLAPVSSRSHTLYGGAFHLIILKHGSLSN